MTEQTEREKLDSLQRMLGRAYEALCQARRLAEGMTLPERIKKQIEAAIERTEEARNTLDD